VALTEQIREAGDPLTLRDMFDEETSPAVREVASASVAAAARYPGDAVRQVSEALIGMYAHGYVVGSLNTLAAVDLLPLRLSFPLRGRRPLAVRLSHLVTAHD
jgi:hypothetical protein